MIHASLSICMTSQHSSGSALNEACRLLARIGTALRATSLEPTPYTHVEGHLENACFGFRLTAGSDNFWVMLWFVAWEQIGESPLFLQVYGPKNVRSAQRLGFVREFRHPMDGKMRYVIPLPFQAGIEPDLQATKLAKLVSQYISQITSIDPLQTINSVQ